MGNRTADLSGFEVIAVVNYMGLDQPVGVGVNSDGKPAFFRLDATSATVAPLSFEVGPDVEARDRDQVLDSMIHHAMDKYRHHIRAEWRGEGVDPSDAFAAFFGEHEVNHYPSRESALLGARDDAWAYLPTEKLIETLKDFQRLGERFEIAGDATTADHYVALAAEYGAANVRRPDPLAAKAEIIRQFGAKAVQLGVPPERESEAGEKMFASMVSTSQKSHAERDRDLRRCHLPVPKRGKPDDDLVQWLDAMPASLRDSTIANNVRAYVPLYEPDPVSEDVIRASAFAKDLESLKAAILHSLDGGSVLAFEDYKRFQEWFEVTHTYEQWDSDADPVNPALLHSAFGELRTAEATAISGWTRDVAVINIASTDTAAFADLGRFVEAGRILNDVADQMISGLPKQPLPLYDTNSNMVGTFTMRADQPPPSASKEGAIQLVLNPWSIAEEDRAQEMATAIREVGVRLSQQTQDDVMFLISDTKGTTIGYVSVDAPALVELHSSHDNDSLSL
jgi:hypothetical protein